MLRAPLSTASVIGVDRVENSHYDDNDSGLPAGCGRERRPEERSTGAELYAHPATERGVAQPIGTSNATTDFDFDDHSTQMNDRSAAAVDGTVRNQDAVAVVKIQPFSVRRALLASRPRAEPVAVAAAVSTVFPHNAILSVAAVGGRAKHRAMAAGGVKRNRPLVQARRRRGAGVARADSDADSDGDRCPQLVLHANRGGTVAAAAEQTPSRDGGRQGRDRGATTDSVPRLRRVDGAADGKRRKNSFPTAADDADRVVAAACVPARADDPVGPTIGCPTTVTAWTELVRGCDQRGTAVLSRPWHRVHNVLDAATRCGGEKRRHERVRALG